MELTVTDPIREEYDAKQAWGLLASIDLHQCNHESIQDPEKIKQFIYELCDRIDMVRHGECLVEKFGDNSLEGHSAFQFIETSSITLHFDDKTGDAGYIDIFSCKYFDPKDAAEFSKEYFEAKDYTLVHLLRK